MGFYSISSYIDDVLSISPFANVFAFGDFQKSHQKDWLTYSGGTDRPGELCYSFSISNNLTQMVNFPTQIPDCGTALLDFFPSSDASICSTMAFPPTGNSDHVIVSVSIEFCESVQVGIDVYIAHHKYQVNPHSMVFSNLCCCHSSQNNFFHLYQQSKSSESTVKFQQASNCCRRVLEADRLAYATKT